MKNWKKDFEYEFGAFATLGPDGRFYNGAFANEARKSRAILSIQSLLVNRYLMNNKKNIMKG